MEEKKIKNLVTTYVVARTVSNDKIRKQFEKKYMNKTEVPVPFCRHFRDLIGDLTTAVRCVELCNIDISKEFLKDLEELFNPISGSDVIYQLAKRTFEAVKLAIREEVHLHLKKAA